MTLPPMARLLPAEEGCEKEPWRRGGRGRRSKCASAVRDPANLPPSAAGGHRIEFRPGAGGGRHTGGKANRSHGPGRPGAVKRPKHFP
jgi:hypothetical protein